MADGAGQDEFEAKAAKWLKWARTTLEEMREHGRHARLDDVERVFFTLLALIASIHEALAAYAKVVGLKTWRLDLNALRGTDPLLLYMWKARDSDTHNALIKWLPSMQQLEIGIVDAAKAGPIARQFYIGGNQAAEAERLLYYAFEVFTREALFDRVRSGFTPSAEVLDRAGIEILDSLTSLSLRSFTIRKDGRKALIEAPSQHLEKQMPPSADVAVSFAIEFYEDKLHELRATGASKQP